MSDIAGLIERLRAELESGDLGEHYKSLHADHCRTEERRAALEKALRDLLDAFDPEAQAIPIHPDGGCIECCSITPKQTGLCLYHRARAALGEK